MSPDPLLTSLLASLRSGSELSQVDILQAVEGLLADNTSTIAKADFLCALTEKGETPLEMAFFAQAFLAHSVPLGLRHEDAPGPLIDVCGTGGDQLHLFNVSTASMFVLAACGASVVKHGNRGVTSKCGSADVLEALGISIDLPPATSSEIVRRHGLVFLFAQKYHPAFKSVAPVRKALAARGVATIFNKLGPLLNPARPPHQLVGVFTPALLDAYPEALRQLGRESAWIVCGSTADGRGLDEMSTLGPTRIRELAGGKISEETQISPADLGLPTATLADLQAGEAPRNAAILTAILDGADTGPRRDIVCLNAAAGLVVSRLAQNLPEALAMAMEAIASGAALAKLNALRGI